MAEQARPGAVHELQLVIFVEREDRDVDFRHHFAQERRRFEGIEPLVAQRFDEGVDFNHDLAERIAAAGPARANGEVSLAKRREQVGQCLQGQDDPFPQREREAKAKGDDDNRERPLDLGGEIAGPEEDERDERARQC